MEEKNSLLNTKVRTDHRLKKDKQFSYIYKKGKKKSTNNFTLFYLASKFENYKIGYSISKKQGKACKRNKLKRRLKEIVRKNNLAKNYFNYIILARENSSQLEFNDIEKEIILLFKKFYKEENLV